MLEKLKLSKSGYYACLKRGPSKTKIRRERITKEVKRIPKESFEIYGSPKITSELLNQGEKVSQRFIHQIMKENNLKVRGSYGIFSSKKIDGKLIIEDNIISTKEDFIYKFINSDDYIGAFALSYKSEIFKEKEYLKIFSKNMK
mgnify:CR=1 FL=1